MTDCADKRHFSLIPRRHYLLALDEQGSQRRGEIKDVTGINDPYAAPQHPQITLNTVRHSSGENARQILAYLVQQDFVRDCTSAETGAPAALLQPVSWPSQAVRQLRSPCHGRSARFLVVSVAVDVTAGDPLASFVLTSVLAYTIVAVRGQRSDAQAVVVGQERS